MSLILRPFGGYVHKIPNPRDPEYWDEEALLAEEKRVFEICNGCRLCWNLCPSFPALFDAIDGLDTGDEGEVSDDERVAIDAHGNHDFSGHTPTTRGDIMGQAEALEQLPLSVHEEVVDLCYQCKLCDPICPFTPPHEFAVDFPRLMLRHKAVHARKNGVSTQDNWLGDPERIGRLGTMVPTFANAGSGLYLNRIIMEKVIGIHRDRQLPKFATQTFLEWFRARHSTRPNPAEVTGKKVVLFYTCSVQWNEPQVGRAAVEVLEHNGFTVFAPEMKCCGMPALDGGDVDRATAWAKHNVDRLIPYVEAGCDIVSPGPTCSFMLKQEYGDYLGTPEAVAVSERSYDLMEYLHKVRKAGELKEDFENEVGEIGYHLPCHLKIQKIGFRSRDILKGLPGAKVKLVDKCSCMDGTWGMKTQHYERSKEWAQPLLDGLTKDAPPTLSSDCLIAKLQIEEGTGQKVVHPIEILRDAYGEKCT
jgi:glycerol-3-phosphate dehydrogenase subunit C